MSFPSPRLDPHRFHSRQHNNDLSRSGFFPPWNHNCSGFVAGMHGAAFFASGQGGAGQKKIFWGCSRVGNSQTRGIFGVGRAGTVLKIFGAGPAIFPRARAGLHPWFIVHISWERAAFRNVCSAFCRPEEECSTNQSLQCIGWSFKEITTL